MRGTTVADATLRGDGAELAALAAATVVGVLVIRLVVGVTRRRAQKVSVRAGMPGAAGRLHAMFDVLGYLGVVIVVAVGGAAMLSKVGVNAGALIASAGVVGFGVGFGAQTLVKDLLNGFFLLAEGQYTIGDVVEINGMTGTVERVTLRTTALRAVNGDLHILASGDIRAVTNRSKGWARVVIDVGISYATPIARAVELLEGLCTGLTSDPEVAGDIIETPEVLGVESFDERQVTVRVVAKVLPLRQWHVGRVMRLRIRSLFEAEGLEAPFPRQILVEQLPEDGATPEA